MNRKEKKELRIERYNELSQKAKGASVAAWERSNDLVKHIPMGQPVQPVGHHSRKRHLNTLDKSWNAMGQSVKLSEKADYYAQKAQAAENNDNIYKEDDDAIERLEKKVEKLTKTQEMMKGANKIVRSKKLSDIEKLEKLQELGYTETQAKRVMQMDHYGQKGFPSYEITNNGANIRNTKEQLERTKKLKSLEAKEYEINGVRFEECPQENRIKLFFNGKPSDEIRSKLKQNAFKWASYEGCWQTYYSTWRINIAKKIVAPQPEEAQQAV